ncbi:hypothetical protein RirG_226950 [Rhizophagus irregularis DAOM 197198w]|uniref:Uncharacterized protein n=1 Tax=Rhizophagus irregularis (strain DAOM 197198w) TaxID=1432141 RepID=A0A015JJZ9_RHIIW|nr:hypothetical protein RirG_226950 [Rhizophagus irregularis DAOM 197198w]
MTSRHHNKKSFLSQAKYDIQMRARVIEHIEKPLCMDTLKEILEKITKTPCMDTLKEILEKITKTPCMDTLKERLETLCMDTLKERLEKITKTLCMHGKYEGMVRTAGFTIGLVSSQLHPRLQPERSLT